jgi:hypothetical protein
MIFLLFGGKRQKRYFKLAGFLAFSMLNVAFAQTGSGVREGLNSDSGAMYGAGIDRVSGMTNNGLPLQQAPGSSMTNGAGTSFMTPNLLGANNSKPSRPTYSQFAHHNFQSATPTLNGMTAAQSTKTN